MRIGEVASRSGFSRDALRYYERIGLIEPPGRTGGGYREYDPSVLDDLRFVRRAQALSLSLEDAAEVMRLSRSGAEPCAHVRVRLLERLEKVRCRVEELNRLEEDLEAVLASLEDAQASPGCHCGAIEAAPGR